MIKPGESIYITATANGFIVRTVSASAPDESLVFNDMGSSGPARDDAGVPYLLGFIERHFSAAVDAMKAGAK